MAVEMVWNIPCEEKTLDRLKELYEFLENFPESELAPVFLSEIEHLESLL